MVFVRRFLSELMDNPILGLVPLAATIVAFVIFAPIAICLSFAVRGHGKERLAGLLLPLAVLPLLAVLEPFGLWGTRPPKPPSPIKTYRMVGKSITTHTEADLVATLGTPTQRTYTEREGTRTTVLTWEHTAARTHVVASFEVTLQPCDAGWCAQRARLKAADEETTYSEKDNARRAARKRWTNALTYGLLGILGIALLIASVVQIGTAFREAWGEAARAGQSSANLHTPLRRYPR